MKDINEVVTWIVGVLVAIVFMHTKHQKKADNDNFKQIFNRQRDLAERMASVEATVAGIQVHFMQTLDDIKAQNTEIAKDMTEIKIALAKIPKRKQDN